jgi:outer membrane protein assembly factor BamA
MRGMTRFALCLFLLVAASPAQKNAASGKISSTEPGKLIAVKVTGTERYTDKEVIAASGLQIGQNVGDGDFKEAVQRLGNSGLFSDAVYSYTSSSAGTKLELQLADTDKSKLVPARFENFVWFTGDELQTALQRLVPLFKHLLPITGGLPDRVSESLQALLSEKGYPGRVDYLREGQDQNGGPLIAITFRVEDVSILVRGFEFPGASPEQAALLATAARRAIGGSYSRAGLAAVAKLDLLPVYLQHGYLKAAFGPSDARVVRQTSSAADAQGSDDVPVDAIIPVSPGKMYLTSGVDWKGNSAIITSELAALLHMPAGQPTDAVRLLHDIENVGKLYRSRGYMAIQLNPNAEFDDEKSTVHYELEIVEGDLYKMGELEILGLDTQAKARVQAAWTLREGQTYNADYPEKFRESIKQLLLRDVLWDVSIHATPDAKDKTVDVEVRFKQQ